MANSRVGSPTLMSVAHAGGQGKTTMAQLLYIASKKHGAPYRLCSADHLDEAGHSKLGKLYPKAVTEFGPGARLTLARNENNANAPLRYWDAIGPVFLEGGAIVDVGANVISGIVEWGVDRNVAALMDRKRAPGVDVFLVCKAQKHALDDMHTLIKNVVSDRPFAFNRLIVVKNEIGGPFYSSFEEGLRNAFPQQPLHFMNLRACQAEIWPAIERHGVSLDQVANADEDELMKILDVDLWTASAGRAEIRAWIDNCMRMIRDLEVFDHDRGDRPERIVEKRAARG